MSITYSHHSHHPSASDLSGSRCTRCSSLQSENCYLSHRITDSFPQILKKIVLNPVLLHPKDRRPELPKFKLCYDFYFNIRRKLSLKWWYTRFFSIKLNTEIFIIIKQKNLIFDNGNRVKIFQWNINMLVV